MFKYALFTLFIFCLFWLHKAKCKNDELQFWERDTKYWPSTHTKPSKKSALGNLSSSRANFNESLRKRAGRKHRKKYIHIEFLNDDSEKLQMREELPSHGQNELSRVHRRDTGPGVPPGIDNRQGPQEDQFPSVREIVAQGGFDLLRRKKPKISVSHRNSESTENESGVYLEIEAYNMTVAKTKGQKQKEKSHGQSTDFFQDKRQRPRQTIPILKVLTDIYKYVRYNRTTKEVDGKKYKINSNFQKRLPDQRTQYKKDRAIDMIASADASFSDDYQHDQQAKKRKRGRTLTKDPEHRSSPADLTLEPKHDSRFKIQGRDHMEGKSDRHHGKADQGHHEHTNSYGKSKQVHDAPFRHENNKHKKPRSKDQSGDQKKKRTKNYHHSEKYSGKGKVTQGLGNLNDEDDKRGPHYNPGRSRHKSNDQLLSHSELKMLSPHSIASQLELVAKKFEDEVKFEQEVIGRTVEYNDIVLWKMTKREYNSGEANFRASANKYADDKAERQIVFIVHGLTIMGWHNLDCLSKVNRFKTLLSYYLDHLSSFDIYLIPMANPDGVAKAFHNHFWNKNMSPQESCPGVHLDRNFDVAWSKNSSLNTSCSHLYPGVMPFSELETKAIRGVFRRYAHKMVAYLHVHAGSYDDSVFKGDAVLFPKGYSDSPDEDKYVDLKGEVDEAMRNASFKVLSVTVDSMHNWYGTVRGTSVDFATTIYGVPYALDLVMQIYKDDMMIENSASREKNSALTEIWKPVFHSIFEQIYKNTVKKERK